MGPHCLIFLVVSQKFGKKKNSIGYVFPIFSFKWKSIIFD